MDINQIEEDKMLEHGDIGGSDYKNASLFITAEENSTNKKNSENNNLDDDQ